MMREIAGNTAYNYAVFSAAGNTKTLALRRYSCISKDNV